MGIEKLVTLVLGTRDLASADLRKIQGELKGMGTESAQAGSMLSKIPVPMMAMAGVAAAAIPAVVGFLDDATKAASEGEVAQQRLTTSLRANVPAWNGDSSAIDQAVKARVRLGFEDDDLTSSMATLVGATHDIGKALDIQSVALDLARYKQISLSDATDALVKVEAGQYKSLKSLGIQLAANATQQDALNAVERVASGQAKDYIGTEEGKTAVLKARGQALEETLGSKLLPLEVEAKEKTLAFMDAMDPDVPQTFGDRIQGLHDVLAGLPIIGQVAVMVGDYNKAQTAAAATTAESQKATDAWSASLQDADRHAVGLSQSMAQMQDADKAFGASVGASASRSRQFNQMGNDAGRAYALGLLGQQSFIRQAWEADFDARRKASSDSDQLIVNNAEIAAQKRILADKSATAAEKAQARIRIRALQQENLDIRLEMTKVFQQATGWGEKIPKNIAGGMIGGRKLVQTAAGLIAQDITDHLQVRSPARKGPLSQGGGPEGMGARLVGLYARGMAQASGGVVSAASLVAAGTVGAVGGSGGGGSAAVAMGGGMSLHVTFQTALPPSRAQVAELVDHIDAELRARYPRFSPYARRP